MLEFKNAGHDSELKRRGFCFLLSVLVHAIFILLCFIFILPLRVNIYYRKVADVIIVSSEKIFIPEADIDRLVSSDLLNEPMQAKEKMSSSSSTDLKSPGSDSKVYTGSSDESAFSLEFLPQFKLQLPEFDKLDLPQEYKLDLSIEVKKQIFPINREDKVLKNIDISKYLYSAWAGYTSSTAYLPVVKRGKGEVQQGNISVQGWSYDLSSWAEQVLSEIQKNWFISPRQKKIFAGRVRILVLIEKNGNISSVKIMTSSAAPLLEKAALKAVNISPFPKLPDDYPRKDLEVLIVFSLQ